MVDGSVKSDDYTTLSKHSLIRKARPGVERVKAQTRAKGEHTSG
jgi:hypothetical protein